MWINDQLRLICQRIHKPWSSSREEKGREGTEEDSVIPVWVQALRSSCFTYCCCCCCIYICSCTGCIYVHVSVNWAQVLESDFNWNQIVQDHPKRGPITCLAVWSHLNCLPKYKKKKIRRVNKNADTTYPPPPTRPPRCLPSGRVGNLMIWKITISNVLARPLPPLNAPWMQPQLGTWVKHSLLICVCMCVFVHKVGTKCLKDYLQIKSFDCWRVLCAF